MGPRSKLVLSLLALQLYAPPITHADLIASGQGTATSAIPEITDSIGLANAIEDAERVTGGHAVKARLFQSDYLIEVVTSGGDKIDVLVDVNSGSSEFEEEQAP